MGCTEKEEPTCMTFDEFADRVLSGDLFRKRFDLEGLKKDMGISVSMSFKMPPDRDHLREGFLSVVVSCGHRSTESRLSFAELESICCTGLKSLGEDRGGTVRVYESGICCLFREIMLTNVEQLTAFILNRPEETN